MAIYGAYSLFGSPEEDFRDTLVHVDSNRINAFISEWESRWNRPPTQQEVDGLIQSYIREDVLYRQAVAMGLNTTFLLSKASTIAIAGSAQRFLNSWRDASSSQCLCRRNRI